MRPAHRLQEALNFAELTQSDRDMVLAHARALRVAAPGDPIWRRLRERNVALISEADEGEEAALFRRAAVELGARVAHVRPSLPELGTAEQISKTAKVLGRLYDALECQGIAPDLVKQVTRAAGVPVYDGLACAGHPTARLVEFLDGDESPADKRRYVLQAVLLSGIG